MKVGTIFTIVLFLVALLGSIGGTSYYYVQSNQAMKQQIYNHLESVVQSRASHVETFLEEQVEKAKILSETENSLFLLKSSKEDSNYESLMEDIQKTLDNTLDSGIFLEVDLWDKNGVVLLSTTRELVGTDYSELDFYKEAKESYYINIYYNPTKGIEQNTLGVTHPIIQDGEFLGIIAISLSLEKLNNLLLDKTGLSETGETYLVNDEDYAISPLLFVEDAILEWKVDSINSRNCFLHEHEHEIGYEGHEEFQIFLDYRGEKVIGTHIYIPEMKWCLLAEISEEEVLGKQRAVFQRVSLIIIIVLVILITLIGFFIGRFIDTRVVLKKGKKSL